MIVAIIAGLAGAIAVGGLVVSERAAPLACVGVIVTAVAIVVHVFTGV